MTIHKRRAGGAKRAVVLEGVAGLFALAGLITSRVQHQPMPSPAQFRDVLLAQLRLMLGIKG
ncbi:hypothetical protein GCM10023322_06730 [Rugosimonospora acidiphila]|uniref:Uncharacterized protein n=1 Tax=Rugosimonospora acidiphila TaxID=556531 RepID=A0ABP9RJA1_9ACTN